MIKESPPEPSFDVYAKKDSKGNYVMCEPDEADMVFEGVHISDIEFV